VPANPGGQILPGGGAGGRIVTSSNATSGNLHLQKGPFSGFFVFIAVGTDSDMNVCHEEHTCD
jgi:hypothetical protein